MSEEKQKIKSSIDLDFIKIIEDHKPEDSEEESSVYVFYCKDCKELVENDFYIRWWKKINKCKICWWERVVSWTESSIKKYYKL